MRIESCVGSFITPQKYVCIFNIMGADFVVIFYFKSLNCNVLQCTMAKKPKVARFIFVSKKIRMAHINKQLGS